jgi:hypothetical protein
MFSACDDFVKRPSTPALSRKHQGMNLTSPQTCRWDVLTGAQLASGSGCLHSCMKSHHITKARRKLLSAF